MRLPYSLHVYVRRVLAVAQRRGGGGARALASATGWIAPWYFAGPFWLPLICHLLCVACAGQLSNGGRYEDESVRDAKAVLKCVLSPVFLGDCCSRLTFMPMHCRLAPYLLYMVIYWGIYAQMSTTFFNQGCQMNLSVGAFSVRGLVLDRCLVAAVPPWIFRVDFVFISCYRAQARLRCRCRR